MTSPRIFLIDPETPDETLIAEAVGILKAGGVVAYPTETFYGLGADGTNEEAIKRIFLIKGRAFHNPLPVIIGAEDELTALATGVNEIGRRLMKAFWPGPLTIIFPACPHVSPRLTGNTGKIGIRISCNPIASRLVRTLGGPLTATSANLSGTAESTSGQEVLSSVGNLLDAVIDGGVTPGGAGSTIVDITCQPPVIVREGIIAASRLREFIDITPPQVHAPV